MAAKRVRKDDSERRGPDSIPHPFVTGYMSHNLDSNTDIRESGRVEYSESWRRGNRRQVRRARMPRITKLPGAVAAFECGLVRSRRIAQSSRCVTVTPG